MSSTFTRGRIISTFTLLAVLASVAGGQAASAASVAPASKASDRSPSASPHAGYAVFSAKRPTLTSDIGQPSDGGAWQLPVGIGLLAVGLLGLLCGLATIFSTRRRAIARVVGAPTRGVPEGNTAMARQAGSGG